MRRISKRAAASTAVVLISVAAAVVAIVFSPSAPHRPTGTIVVQSFAFHSRAGKHPSEMTITETSAGGRVERLLQAASFEPSIETVSAGEGVSTYLARDNTIYAMTLGSLRAASARLDRGRSSAFPSELGRAETGTVFAPGRVSYFKRLLDMHVYRVAGRTMIDGRPALELVRTRQSRPRTAPQAAVSLRLFYAGTAYVSPRTYAPIKDVIKQPGGPAVTISWTRYRVLPATGANRRLLSLAARHPNARITHDAAAYLRAIRTIRPKP